MNANFVYPKPRDWESFEDIVADVFSRLYQSYNLQRYARRGQAQHGVDIAGPTTKGFIGIQCKHHPDSDIPTSEIDTDIIKADGFSLPFVEYIIATSAKRDEKATRHVFKLNEARQRQGQITVVIHFWEDIVNRLLEYPELVYKHFSQYFPIESITNFNLPGLNNLNKHTRFWPVTAKELQQATAASFGGLPVVSPYNLSLGFSTFPDTSFDRLVDLEVNVAQLFSDQGDPVENFKSTAQILTQVKQLVVQPNYSKEILVRLQARLAPALLLGWIFRRVTHFDLLLPHRDQVWSTRGLPHTPDKLLEDLPVFVNNNSSEVVLILNITRHIRASVLQFVSTNKLNPKIILSYTLEGHVVLNGAQALSVARETSRKIKQMVDSWGVTHVHLFPIMPAALATLIGFHLNAICLISIYFLQNGPADYRLAGVIDRKV